MPKPEIDSSSDELDRLLEKWAGQLPEPPVSQVESTLRQLRQTTPPRRSNGWRWLVLGGMAAAIMVIIIGAVVVLTSFNNKSEPQAAVSTNLIPTVTPTPEQPTSAVRPPVVAALPQQIPTATPLATATETAPTSPSPVPTASPTPLIASQNTVSSATVTPVAPINNPTAVPTITSPVDAPNRGIPRKPTEGGVPIEPGTPIKPATPIPAPTATPVSDPSEPRLPSVAITYNGIITAVNANSLTLNNHPDPILFGPNTRVIINGAPSTVGKLVIGHYVSIVALSDNRGQLVAQVITATTKVPPIPKPPSE